MKEEILLVLEEIKNGQIDCVKNKLESDGSLVLTTRFSVDGQKLLAIHYASKYGQLEIVKLLLNKKPALLNAVDEANQTPVSFAAMQGHVHVVEYLVSIGANLSIAINNPYHHHYGYLPIQWAVERGHLAVVQCLIRHGADIDIRLGEMQSHLIHIASKAGQLKIIQLLLDQNPALLNTTDACNQTPAILAKEKGFLQIEAYLNSKNSSLIESSRYKCSGRRPSMFEKLDKRTGTYTVYKPFENIAEGGCGFVRSFKSQCGQMIIVKSLNTGPVAIISQKQQQLLHEQLKKESNFHFNAYPDHMIQTFEFNHERQGRTLYEYRYIMPFYTGETAYHLLPQITCVRRIAEIIVKIAEELDRIHRIGIIHGDLNPSNIMIYFDENKITIQLIDFEYSYSINDQLAIAWSSDLSGHYWFAPELCTEKHEVKPHSNQDVFGFAFALNMMLPSNPSYENLMQSFPSIRAFICTALSEAPMFRPSLSEFNHQLTKELNLFTKKNNATFFKKSHENALNTASSSLNKRYCTIS